MSECDASTYMDGACNLIVGSHYNTINGVVWMKDSQNPLPPITTETMTTQPPTTESMTTQPPTTETMTTDPPFPVATPTVRLMFDSLADTQNFGTPSLVTGMVCTCSFRTNIFTEKRGY